MSIATDTPLLTLFRPFELGHLHWPAQGGGLLIGARDGWPLHQRSLPDLVCESSFKPDVDALLRSGLAVREPEDTRYPLVMVLPPRQREHARATLARALDRVAPGGVLLACQANDEGAKSGEADLRKLAGPIESLAKHHCRVYWARAETGSDPALLAEWRELDAPRPILDGRFHSRPGLFAWDRVDPASRLLVEQLPDDLAGAAADLGAGYGYLSASLLQRCVGIHSLDLFEAEARALPLAEKNLEAHAGRVAITPHWHDVIQGVPGRYDVIVCNPPFHTQRAGDRPDIGRRFIAAAAASLNPGGQLWLVANRHLPYEAELAQGFDSLRTVCQRDGFKVVQARRAGGGG
ncbi:class I SAM-dependent methyltransferase [Pseudomarimonas salicorniae]|uniref:Class I SAM-dependent methyltransferase n=1 Tax=Pseudomarimonas salicorniae TaxID=2933270 RepID=A0ABT0GHF9_9GAMM|nr:class I SAM-dependent methyltransferase [Lysobacter sp. CAU 1642]MCK7593973.1 class I SAM-dependent methyltransferase [Lysobacter sp. CAU 1642]